jgi:hypothetical protein
VDETEAWRLLGLEPGSSEDQVRAAYRDKARFRHPDHHPGRDEAPYAELMRQLADAREVAVAATRSGVDPATPPTTPPVPSTWRGLGRWIGFWRSKS